MVSVQNTLVPWGADGKGRVWDRGRVELVEPSVTKGTYALLYDRAVLTGASFCYFSIAMVPPEWTGKRIRAFGTSTPLFAPWGDVGVIGVELVEP